MERKHLAALGLLMALSLSIKFAIWQLPPQVFRDSPGYLVPASSLLDGRGYGVQENGFRTPTYPLVLALILSPFDRTHLSQCRDAHDAVCIDRAAQTADGLTALRAIVFVHILLGLGITIILYMLGWTLTHNVWVASLFSAGYGLNPVTAFWEISILTETLTTFLLVLSVYLTFRLVTAKSQTASALALGLVLGMLALCHSLFLIYWLLPAAFLFFRAWRKKESAFKPLLIRLAPIIFIPPLFLGIWSSFNYFVNGYLTPSTLSGYVLIQMVAPVIENAPPGYEGLTEVYIGYRNAMIAETGSYSGAIFRAWPDMLKARDMTWSELSSRLSQLSLYLMVAYPGSYLQVAREGWVRFWGFAFYHYAPVPDGPATWMLWFTDAGWQAFWNDLFWISPLMLLFAYRLRRRAQEPIPFAPIIFLMLTVWFAALIVTLTNFQDNARHRSYVLPLQYGAIITTLWAIWQVRVHKSL